MSTLQKTKIKSVAELSHTLKVGVKELVKTAKNTNLFYRPFDLNKKVSKKWRHIDNPTGKLKITQKAINKQILRELMFQLPSNIMGGIENKSILKNAQVHVGQEMVVTIDIKNCFPKTKNEVIFAIWKNLLEFDSNSARLLTQLTTINGHLPQGSPASPSLSNLALLPISKEILNYSKKHHLNFTMYVDDITLSGKENLALDSIGSVIKIIQKHGYAIRSKKIKKMPSYRTQTTTGIQLNLGISIGKQKVDEIRKEIINLAKLQKPYISRKSIFSKIDFINKISPEKGEKLLEFANMLLDENIDYVAIDPEKDTKRDCDGKRCLAK